MTDADDGADLAVDVDDVPVAGFIPRIGATLLPDTPPRLPLSPELSPGLSRKAEVFTEIVESTDSAIVDAIEAEALLAEADPHSLSVQSEYFRLCRSLREEWRNGTQALV